MQERPAFLVQGERARLFPVLSVNSKEGRATSIFLSCLANVDEYAGILLGSVGRNIGTNSRTRTYTEVCFDKAAKDMERRPDGLIDVCTGRSNWYALVEAKIGSAELSKEQIASYLKIAKENSVDAVITISNQFAASPQDHPVSLSARELGGVKLYHWSWMHLLTEADLLLSNDGVSDRDQKVLLNEFRRFLTHDSTGVKGFERMPPEWPVLVRDLGTGAQVQSTSPALPPVVFAWHQELRDLCLILSRQLGVTVSVKLPRAEVRDQKLRQRNEIVRFVKEPILTASLDVPEAAADICVDVDVRARNMSASMSLDAPEDRKKASARVNWLLKQIKVTDREDVYIRIHWPRRGFTQYLLSDLQRDVSPVNAEHPGKVPTRLEVVLLRQTGGRFAQMKNFIEDIERLVPDFYSSIGAGLKAWAPSAPRIKSEREEASDVTTEAISEDAERAVGEIETEENG